MEELSLNYYFKELQNFTYKEIFNNCTYPWEVLNRINSFLKENIVDKDIKVNKANTGEFCSINGNYFIDEGTTIHSNVVIEGPVLIRKKCNNTIAEL